MNFYIIHWYLSRISCFYTLVVSNAYLDQIGGSPSQSWKFWDFRVKNIFLMCFWLILTYLEARSAAKWSHINFIIKIRDIWAVSKILPKIFFQVVTPVLHKVKKTFISKWRFASWVWSLWSHSDRFGKLKR